MKKLTTSVYSFEQMRENDIFYVDKTEYLWKLVQSAPAMYFLSRPRRFGKSLTLSTLKAIFQGKKDLFKGLAIYDKPYDWKEYPVIHLSMTGHLFDTVENLEQSFRDIIQAQARENGVTIQGKNAPALFQS